MQDKKAQITEEEVAEKLVWGLWRSILEDYKTKYVMSIWEHLENALKSASYTDSLKVFLNNFKLKIPLQIQAQYNNDILHIVESGEDEKILNWLRNESTYIVMIVRLKNQERKENIKLAHG